jgi:hypothetical protein
MEVSITWKRSPDHLAQAIRTYGEKVEQSALAAADNLARQAALEMRQEAPWQDQTGEARRSLFGRAWQSPDGKVTLTLGHGVDYGIYLEFKNGGRFAIVGPTLLRLYPELEAAMRSIFA